MREEVFLVLFGRFDGHRDQRAAELDAALPNILLTGEVEDRQAHAAGGLAHGCDVVEIAAETSDETTDPFESDSLVVQAVVRGH